MPKYLHEHNMMLPIVREAGAAVMQFFASKNYAVQHKDAENPVTEADFAANRILQSALRKFFPGDAILSEEGDSEFDRDAMERERFDKKRVWIIDPIDGTREFIKGRDQFAVSVGLIEDARPVLGFIFNPARNYLVSGGTTLGLFNDGKPFVPPARAVFHPPESLPKIVVSRSEQKNGHLARLEQHYGNLSEQAIGSIAYKLALVADGTYDLAVSVKPKNEWDIAGGAALIAAQGLELWEGNFLSITFNKLHTELHGIVAGTREACDWYREMLRL